MTGHPPLLHRTHPLTGLAVTLFLHLALVFWWNLPTYFPNPDAAEPDPVRIQWVAIQPPRPVMPRRAVASPPKPDQPARHRRVRELPQTQPPASLATQVVTAPQAITAPPAEAPQTASAYEMMQQARKDLGKIDKDLRNEFPGAPIKAPADSPQIRFERGIEHAAEMAPPKWFEAPKIRELIDPGGYGRRRYRVITAKGTYCVTYESNHAPDGLDSVKNGIKPKLTSCPKDEQPATTQKYEK